MKGNEESFVTTTVTPDSVGESVNTTALLFNKWAMKTCIIVEGEGKKLK